MLINPIIWLKVLFYIHRSLCNMSVVVLSKSSYLIKKSMYANIRDNIHSMFLMKIIVGMQIALNNRRRINNSLT